MRFPQPLTRGRLVARYKRFFADVVLDDGTAATAHVANPGKMLGLLDEGAACWLSWSDSRTRKLPWTVEIMEERATGTLVGVNTAWPNRLVEDAVTAGTVPELAGYAQLKREARYGSNSRIDLLLEEDGRAPCWVEVKSLPAHLQQVRRCWVEVKSATLSRQPGLAEWPDCVSSRTAGQLGDMRALIERGDRAVLLFLVQRSDCTRFAPAADLDPVFGHALRNARTAGVEVLCYYASPTPSGIQFGRRLPTMLD